MLLGRVGTTADSRQCPGCFPRPATWKRQRYRNGWGPAPPVIDSDPTVRYSRAVAGPSRAASINGSIAGPAFGSRGVPVRTAERRTNGYGRPGQLRARHLIDDRTLLVTEWRRRRDTSSHQQGREVPAPERHVGRARQQQPPSQPAASLAVFRTGGVRADGYGQPPASLCRRQHRRVQRLGRLRQQADDKLRGAHTDRQGPQQFPRRTASRFPTTDRLLSDRANNVSSRSGWTATL